MATGGFSCRGVTFDFSRQSVAVNHYYFYLQDPEWDPAFLKFGTYLPYPMSTTTSVNEKRAVYAHMPLA